MIDEKEIKKYIFEILDESGIYIDSSETEEDLDLREYIVDSLQYVYFIVELEERLGVELDDEILVYDNLSSINGFANMIINMLQNTEHDTDNQSNNRITVKMTERGTVVNMSNC